VAKIVIKSVNLQTTTALLAQPDVGRCRLPESVKKGLLISKDFQHALPELMKTRATVPEKGLHL
jgi:hypothetical protein